MIVFSLATLIFVEGVRALYLHDQFHESLLSEGLNRWTILSLRKGGSEFSQGLKLTSEDHPFLEEPKEMEEFIPELKGIHAGVGNTNFHELVDENSSVNGYGRCAGMKPDLKKFMIHIKSIAFDIYDPPMVFFDRDARVPEKLNGFLNKYQFSRKNLTTNEFGERITLPFIERKKKVLIAGDSVAMGIAIGDEEALSSRLQQMDSTRQYINTGVSGAYPEMIFCLLNEAIDRHRGDIDEVIYIFCDNDFPYLKDSGGPANFVKKLRDFQIEKKIKKIKVIRAPYVFDIPPIIHKYKRNYETALDSQTLAAESKKAGFDFLDIRDMAIEEAQKNESMYGFFPLFIDRVHLSPYGTGILAEKLLGR